MFGTFTVNGSQTVCTFWHLALRQLPEDDPLGAKVTRIKTSLGLEQADQEALIRAARRLIEQSLSTLRAERVGPVFLRDLGGGTVSHR